MMIRTVEAVVDPRGNVRLLEERLDNITLQNR